MRARDTSRSSPAAGAPERRHPRVAAAIAIAILGCGGNGTLADGGMMPGTRGEQCMQIVMAICDRTREPCQIITSDAAYNDCLLAGMNDCCGTGCGAPAIADQSNVDACVAAAKTAPCESLDVLNGGMGVPSCAGFAILPLAVGQPPGP